MKAPVEEISFSGTCGNLAKYQTKYDLDDAFKSTPSHVKGSILHNIALKERPELLKTYPLILQSEKIKIVKI